MPLSVKCITLDAPAPAPILGDVMLERADRADCRGSVAVVVRGGRLLVIRRSRRVVAPGAYCFPGGALEDGESEEQALVREMQEELGVSIHPIRRLWRSVTPWNVELAWWLAVLPPDERLAPNPEEVESVHWVTPAEMADLPGLLSSNRDFLEALADGRIELELDS